MQKRNFRGALRNLFVMSSASLVLTGCLMDDEEAASDAETVTDNEISGSVGDGPVVGAAMRVVASNGTLLAEFESDASANYNVTVRTKGKDYPLMVDARNGIDLVTTLAPDFVLLSAVREPGKKTVANLNPFSTLAVEAARDLPDGLSKQGLAIAEGHVVATLGVALTTLAQTGPVSTPVDASNIAELVKASEEVGEIIRRVRDLQLAFGRPATGDTVLQAIASDSIDGIIDGRGGSRVDARVAALTNIVAVQVLLESMQNELHVNGSDASAALASAIARVGGAGVEPALEDLVVTPATLEMVDVGLDAILAVLDDPGIAGIADAVTGLQGGMDPVFISSLVPADYRSTLDNALLTIAGSGDATIDTVNDVVRTGGTEPPPVNEPPTISGNPGTNVEEGNAYSFTPTASDPNGDVLTFAISGQPGWADFDTANGTLSGVPASGDAGTYAGIVISVTDGEFTASLPVFTITVTAPEPPPPANEPPTISGTPATNVEEGNAYAFTPAASDPNGDVLTFAISGQPGWADFDTANGTLSGVPASGDAGTYAGIVISVTDGEFTASLPVFTITVTAPEPPPANEPPTISGNPGTNVEEGNAYAFTPTASDPNGDVLTFAISGQPGWADFDTANGTLSGVPASGDAGTYAGIVISVTDGEFTASLPAFTITVTAPEPPPPANEPPTISGTPGTSVEEGNTYSFTPTASDPNGDVLTFMISGPPGWASFDTATGTLSGTPASGDAGTYPGIVISVTDGEFTASLPAFTITVTAPEPPPPANQPPTISGTPAAEVNANSAYAFTPGASDPDGDSLTFSVSGQPAWAAFDAATGTLSGTPGDADVGLYENIVISVTDGEFTASLPAFSITVNAISLGSVTLTWTPPTENDDGTALTDLAGYRIYWGTTPGVYTDSVTLDNPGLTSYVVEGLAPGTYEFVATSYNAAGVESVYSNPATKAVP